VPEPVEAVLFDFSGTFVRAEPLYRRLDEARVRLPDREVVAKGLSVTSGASATTPARVPWPTSGWGRLLGYACGRSPPTALCGDGSTG
jgi:hypothetical protein